MKILYMEDNPLNVLHLERYLETTEHHLSITTDVAATLAVLERERFDLILIDILIDGQYDGYELARTLRQRGNSTPMVAVTALGASATDAVRLAGFDGLLMKPFTIHNFAQLLGQYETNAA